ncbi:DEAD/DEAH box helicase, partial [Corynebacterium vitaeruminis]
FRVLVHHGTSRLKDEEFLDAVGDYDLVITSYGTIARDHKLLSQVTWHRVTLDEAQQIKNSGTKVSKAVRSLKSAQRVALTGTPVENRLSELRNILDFCNPGILGDAKTFRTHFATAIEKSKDDVKTERLRALTAPFILRRLKTDPAIIDDLPEKTEVVLTVEMTTEQAALYTAYVDSMQKAIQEAQGMSRRGLVLASLTKIKQICNHP